MRTPTFFIPPAGFDPAPGAALRLEGDEATHLARVLRLGPGAEVEVFDGEGRAARCAVEQVDRRACTLRVVEPVSRAPALPFTLTCAVATPKRKRRQRLVETLTELNVTRYHPLRTQRAQNADPDAEHVRRWSIEAAKQCGRGALLEPGPVLDLDGLIAVAAAHDLALLPDTARARPLGELLRATPAPPPRVLLAIGPEGGFTDDERTALHAAGLSPVTVGATVLRIETAVTAVVGALVAAWG